MPHRSTSDGHRRPARQLAAHEKRLDTRYLVGLPRDALLAEVARLSRDTIVVVLSIFRDGTGRDFVPVDIAEEIFNASKAPVYSPYDTLLGRGTVGGYMISFEAVGTETADLVLDILGGKHASALPLRASNAHAYRVDARQLARWSLSAKNLPAGAQVLFEQPTLWEEHRELVLFTLGAFGAIATILGNLLLQMHRRRRAEASLKESEERMTFAVASTNTGLWQYDVPSKELWATEQCHALFGLAPGSPLGVETLLRRVHPDDRAIALGAIRAASARAELAERCEFRVVRPNGEVLWILASGKTHFDEEGKPVKVSGVFRDVTARKIAEHETEQLARRLSTIQDEERQQIAEELHDSTTQHLVAVGLNMMSLRNRVGGDAENRKLLEEIEGSLDEATKELRTFTYLLHPPQLEKDGLQIRAAPLRRWLRQANQAPDPAQDRRQRPRSCRSPCSEPCCAWFRRPWPTCIVTLRHRRSPSPSNAWPTAFTWWSPTMARAPMERPHASRASPSGRASAFPA